MRNSPPRIAGISKLEHLGGVHHQAQRLPVLRRQRRHADPAVLRHHGAPWEHVRGRWPHHARLALDEPRRRVHRGGDRLLREVDELRRAAGAHHAQPQHRGVEGGHAGHAIADVLAGPHRRAFPAADRPHPARGGVDPQVAHAVVGVRPVRREGRDQHAGGLALECRAHRRRLQPQHLMGHAGLGQHHVGRRAERARFFVAHRRAVADPHRGLAARQPRPVGALSPSVALVVGRRVAQRCSADGLEDRHLRSPVGELLPGHRPRSEAGDLDDAHSLQDAHLPDPFSAPGKPARAATTGQAHSGCVARA